MEELKKIPEVPKQEISMINSINGINRLDGEKEDEISDEELEEAYRQALKVIQKSDEKIALNQNYLMTCFKEKGLQLVDYALTMKIHVYDIFSYFYNRVYPLFITPRDWVVLSACEKDEDGLIIDELPDLSQDYIRLRNSLKEVKHDQVSNQLWIEYTYMDVPYTVINPLEFPFPVVDGKNEGYKPGIIFAEDDLGNDLTELCKKVLGPNGDFYKGLLHTEIKAKYLTTGTKVMIMMDDGQELEFSSNQVLNI